MSARPGLPMRTSAAARIASAQALAPRPVLVRVQPSLTGEPFDTARMFKNAGRARRWADRVGLTLQNEGGLYDYSALVGGAR